MKRYIDLIKFEFSRKTKGMLTWIILWSLFISLIFVFYDSLVSNTEQLKMVLQQVPKELLEALGTSPENLTSLAGILNSRYTLFSIIIGGIWAGFQGAQIIGKDDSSGSLTWLVTQPLTRMGIYFSKWFVLISWFAIINFAIMFAAIGLIKILTSVDEIPYAFFMRLGGCLTIYYTLLAAVGNIGAVLWNEERGRNMSILTVIFSYSMNVVRIFEDAPEFVKYLTSYFYFDPDAIARNSAVDPKIHVLTLITTLLIVTGAFFFRERSIGD